ncbi:hypothetical protein [Deinococcus peraridilitoris]|uniref:hypothetical protein n=1 Tax=Deinococcus peraridilitoris TaxID=432329 RepID=UPI0012F71AE1|nr:hypothetical protein [Deinococcus peraridilitoris]
MIQHFPENNELIWLFESEPEVFDPRNSWPYDTLTFRTRRDDIDVLCEMKPYRGKIVIRLYVGEHEVVCLELYRVTGVFVNSELKQESLVVWFEKSKELQDLELVLKPQIKIKWGSTL